jgi:hypothetical protein
MGKTFIVGLTAAAQSGKDTFVDLATPIVRDLVGPDFPVTISRDALATDLKRIGKDHFGWTGHRDEKTEGELGRVGRRLLQLIGTEVGRAYFDHIWVSLFSARNEIPVPANEQLPQLKLSDEDKTTRIDALFENSDFLAMAPTYGWAALIAAEEFFWDFAFDEKGERLVRSIANLVVNHACGEIDVGVESSGLLKSLSELVRRSCSAPSIPDLREKLLRAAFRNSTKTSVSGDRILFISDVRFPNEGEFVKRSGGIMVQIRRKGKVRMTHASETSMQNYPFDLTVENPGDTLENYRREVEKTGETVASMIKTFFRSER